MSEFTYKETGKNIGWDFSKMSYKKIVPTNFYYYKECAKNINFDSVVLDVGCGSCEKSLQYFSHAKKVVFMDNETEMLKKAQANANKFYGEKYQNKFVFEIGDCENLKYENESFDVVVSRHCGTNMKDAYRILKKGGIFLSEDIDKYDCWELKKIFNRGQEFNDSLPIKKKIFNDALDAGFSKIELLNFEEIEFYNSIEDLEFLLINTPTIDGYDREKDFATLKKYVEANTTEKGIKLVRRLFAYKIVK